MSNSNSRTSQRVKSIFSKFFWTLFVETFLILGLQPLLLSVFSINQKTVQTYNMDLIIKYLAVLIFLGFMIYSAWKIWKWNKEDETLKRKDFIDTLSEVLEAQKNLSEKSITLHVQDLKDNFLKEIKEVLKKDKINKEDIIKKLDHDFKHHHITFNANLEKIDNLKSRLERHKYDDILEEIRAEKTL